MWSLCTPRYTRQLILQVALSRSGKTNARVGSIKDRVVVLQELLADNSIYARAAAIVDPGVILARG